MTEAPARKGFFTDTSICIGCKACEVACKEWNAIPADGGREPGVVIARQQGQRRGDIPGLQQKHVSLGVLVA